MIKNLNNENLICYNAYQEDRIEEKLTDNNWYLLKMPSFKNYNLLNAGNDWASKLWIDDRLSDSQDQTNFQIQSSKTISSKIAINKILLTDKNETEWWMSLENKYLNSY